MKHIFNIKDWKFMSQRQRLSPFPNYLSPRAMCVNVKRYTGVSLDRVFILFEDRIATYFPGVPGNADAGDKLVQRLMHQPQLFSKCISQETTWGNKLVRAARHAGKEVSARTPVARMVAWVNEFQDNYLEVYGAYCSVLFVEAPLTKVLLEIIQKRITSPERASELLGILSREPRAMVARIERQDLYALTAKVSAAEAWRTAFLEGKEIADKAFTALVSAHEKKYFWVTRDYEDPVLDKAKIIVRLRECMHENPETKYQEMVQELKNFSLEARAALKELHLTRAEQALFHGMREVAYLKELRKKFVSQALYYFDPVLLEVARQSGLTLKQVRFLKIEEYPQLLAGKNMTDVVNARIACSVWSTQ